MSNQQIQHPLASVLIDSFMRFLEHFSHFWLGRWNLAWSDIIIGYL